LLLRKFALRADDTTIEATGNISNVNGPVGELTVKADALGFDRLLAFASDFAKGSGFDEASAGVTDTPHGGRVAPPSKTVAPGNASAQTVPMKVAVTLTANRATFGTLAIGRLSGHALLTEQGVTLEPISFELFHGRYEGTLRMMFGDVPDLRLRAS